MKAPAWLVTGLVLAACAPDADSIPDAGSAPPSGGGAVQADRAVSGSEADPRPAIVFLGTSLTAGLGVDPEEAYPAVIRQKLDSAGLDYRVVNAGVSGDTSAGGLRRLDWLLEQPLDVLVLELGANDGLRGHDPDATRENLNAIVERVLERYPEAAVVLVGMEAPPNLGDDYTARFRQVFADLAAKWELPFVPFLLEGVAAEPSLNQADGIHPNAAGHRILADNVWAVLEPVLRQRVR